MAKPVTLALAAHLSWSLKLDEGQALKICEIVSMWSDMLDDGAAAFAACESPAERLFLLGLRLNGYEEGRQPRFSWNTDLNPTAEDFADGDNHIARVLYREKRFDLYAQRSIDEYHVDFSFEARGVAWEDPLFWGVAIEIDGHDFHEKTKAQASADRKRDRAVQCAGYSVIRFTGSDIYRDPVEAMTEALDAAWLACWRVERIVEHAEHNQLEKLTAPHEVKMLPAKTEDAAENGAAAQ